MVRAQLIPASATSSLESVGRTEEEEEEELLPLLWLCRCRCFCRCLCFCHRKGSDAGSLQGKEATAKVAMSAVTMFHEVSSTNVNQILYIIIEI